MKGLFSVLTALLLVAGCKASEPPTQVVYRFDDHRYLELKGWDCEGELWYTDTQKGIHTEPVSQFYRIFTHKFIHPSERYISICSGQLKLATALEFFQYRFSDSFGGNPPL